MTVEYSSTFVEHERTIVVDGLQLQGTLCLPTSVATSDAVLFLSGSGELDRNGNGAKMQLNTANTLANSLAAHGIASFRYDKRGCAQSDGDYYDTGFFDLLTDARAVLKALDSFPELAGKDRYLLGHSEGTLIAAYLSQESNAVKGQILLMPFLENLEYVVEKQLAQAVAEMKALPGFRGHMIRLYLLFSGDQLKKQRKLMKRVRKSNKASMKIGKQLINAKWLREHMSIEPRAIHEKVSLPTLCIGGAKDLQCLPEDALTMAELVDAPVETHILENMTHILRTDEQAASTFRYKELCETDIDDQFATLITHWLSRQSTE